MIEFVICDDDKLITEHIIDTVSNIMMRNKLVYKTHVFHDYDDTFLEFIACKQAIRIYILDIETPSRSGIDVARIIRETDIDSIIIFLTGHEELGPSVLKKELWFLAFINKFEESDERLNRAINKALSILNVRNTLRFEERGVLYTISLNDILYITRDSVDRKSVIVTERNEYKTYKTLVELIEILDERFVQTHRACIVNSSRVTSVNKLKRIITFDCGRQIDLLSVKYKRELDKSVK